MKRHGSEAPRYDMPLERKERRTGGHVIDLTPRTRLFTQLDLHSEANFFTGFSGSLLDGGLFVVTYEPLRVGQAVLVEVSLPGGELLSARGRVAWLRDPLARDSDLSPGAGIVFEGLDESMQRAFDLFMAHREPHFVVPE